MKFEQSLVSKRFVEIFDKLKEMKAFKTQSEFAEKVDFSTQSLTEILKGRRDVTIELLRKLFITYKVRPSFIFDSELLKEEELKNVKGEKKGVFPFSESEEFKSIELSIKRINFLYQKIVDVYVICSNLHFDANFDELNPFAELRNKAIDNGAYKRMNIEQLIEYNKELGTIINTLEDYFFKKHKDLFYNVVTTNKALEGVKKPLKKKK